ncbi:TetR/AcrR family transcriptional regulator [Aeromicrobium sp. Leaf350]|uniref:TetR/AcrR family transcriptional regulator n=1 Tax=Aeromicrobium sp. Leaf350 TaxID=2876565 RepID=UPI001E30D5D6|nr:TetR/AcrR family transcriptional regulator [Aeromicrobium sp. Leaf350]
MAPDDDSPTRPRVTGDRELEILDATIDVLAEVGYDRLTMDAVAQAAKASKATLYRLWSSKATLVLEALLVLKDPPAGELDTGSLRGDLLAMHCGSGRLTDPRLMAVFSSIITALGHDEEFAAGFREKFIGPKIARSREIYRRAAERGELRDGVDVDLVAPALAGIILHREFLLGLPPDVDVIETVIDQIILPAALRPSLLQENA